jgi:ferredoxin
VRVMVNQFECDGHGMCVAAAPDAFKQGSDRKGYALFVTVPPEQHDAVRRAADACPQRAVKVLESKTES